MSIPCHIVQMSHTDKPWMTPTLKLLINERWNAFRERNFSKYHHYKQKVKLEILKAKAIWVKKNEEKNVWRLLQSASGKTKSQDVMQICEQYPNVKEAADAINYSFLENYQKSDLHAFPLTPLKRTCIQVNEMDVFNELCQLNATKASPDIPIELYKSVAHIIAKPLSILCNLSLASAVIPSLWKCATVIPVPKVRNPKLKDLRPISLLPIPMKILERLVLRSVKADLISGYGSQQYGFRPHSSTTCALISLHDYCTKRLEEPNVSGLQIIAYDFSKAFDKLKFEVVLSRLRDCQIPAMTINWIRNYFDGRTQYVRIGMETSDIVPVPSGVPQGSVIAPYLFSIVTGSFDISHLPSCVVKYADDFTICVPIYRDKHNGHVLEAHSSMVRWSNSCGLPLNIEKCKSLEIPRTSDFVSVTIHGIESVDNLKLLGVIFDAQNNWSSHVSHVIRSASRNMFLIRSLKTVLPPDSLIMIFNSIVRSILEYCSPLFVGLSLENSKRLERVQRRFHRFLCGKDCEQHFFVTLSQRREKAALKLFDQAMSSDHILHPLVPSVSRSGRVCVPSVIHERRLRSFFVKASFLFNQRQKR